MQPTLESIALHGLLECCPVHQPMLARRPAFPCAVAGRREGDARLRREACRPNCVRLGLLRVRVGIRD